jgi:hypothetical protein
LQKRDHKNARIRLGRPPGPAGTTRSRRVVTFVTDPEFERLRELADASGKSLSAILHDLVSLSLERSKRTSPEAAERTRATETKIYY